jgi:hypothetical protein
MAPGEITYSMNTDGRVQYYIDTGASSHFIEEIGTLHDYVPFKVPRTAPPMQEDAPKMLESHYTVPNGLALQIQT